MDKKLKIKTKDGYVIRGILHQPSAKLDKVVVFVHGLSSHYGEHQYHNGYQFFNKNGFSVFRFNLYDWLKDSRQMVNCDIYDHASDIERVVAAMKRQGFKKIFLVGHSYGGPSIILSDLKDVDGIVLWDPTDRLDWIWKKTKLLKTRVKYNKSLKAYVCYFGVDILVGKKMRTTDLKVLDVTHRVKNVHVPIKFILAGKGMLVPGGKKYYKNANKPKAITVIKNATHNFDEDGTEEKLFAETFSWLRKFS